MKKKGAFLLAIKRWDANPRSDVVHKTIATVFLSGFLLVVGMAMVQLGIEAFPASADTASTSATVQNQSPSASSVSIDSGAGTINLTENTTTAVTCTATITDNNGCEDIENGSAKLYRTNVGAGCGADDNSCYATTCTIDGGSCTPGGGDITATYTCAFNVQYYADPTDAGSANEATNWSCQVTPQDGTGAGSTDTDTIEMATLTALNVTATIAFGSLSLGADTGASNQTTTVSNTGNEDMDPQLSGTDMTCTTGSIPVANQKYGGGDVTYASLPWNLSGTPTTRDFSLPQRTGAAVTDLVYWGLAVPASGVQGSCSGSNSFTAVSGL